jgi:hypothetical protein
VIEAAYARVTPQARWALGARPRPDLDRDPSGRVCAGATGATTTALALFTRRMALVTRTRAGSVTEI